MKRRAIVGKDSLIPYLPFLIVALFFLKGLLGSVEAKQQEYCCQKINKNQEVVFLRFEETRAPENKGKWNEIVHFRIRNNTTCEVLLISPDTCLRRVNGVWTSAVEDGEEVNVFFEIETKKGRFQHYKNDQLFVVHLLPGRSCIFPVLSSYLKKTNTICVPYRYAWENSSVSVGDSSLRCEARFYANDLAH